MAIEKGDAIVVYFAGHGSSILGPRDWFEEGVYIANRRVEVLCPYDHDMTQGGGRIAGISDRSMHALLNELAQSKGDNITFIADCCFSPSSSRTNGIDRSSARWTPTAKAKPDDLYAGLWPNARGQPRPRGHGFYTALHKSHVFLASCRPGEFAIEGKNGGAFTDAFLQAVAELSLHRTSYATLFDHIQRKIGIDHQLPICLGTNKSRIVFDAIPFVPDSRLIPVKFGDLTRVRVEAGAAQGIAEGCEFSLHLHNYRASRNPNIGTLVVFEVHPTWCFGRLKSPTEYLPQACWAQVTRWNNRRPFRVYLKTSLASICRWWKLRRILSNEANKGGLNVLLVKSPDQANISMTIGHRTLTVKRNDDKPIDHARRVSKFENRDPVDVIDDAARFNLHLYRRNPNSPLKGLVNMELFRLNPTSWAIIGENLLHDGKASIPHEKEDIFTVVIKNTSDVDLWPYLFYMDPISFAITKIYDPQSSFNQPSPLPSRSQFIIGSGHPGSEALSFSLGDDPAHDSGYLNNSMESPLSQETASLVSRLAGPSTGKAGLAKDQTEINRIIAEASKGSKFYENEKKKDKDLTQRIEKILQMRDDLLTGVDIESVETSADRLISELEAQRDLSQKIVHVDMDAFYANVELLDNPDLAGKPFGVGYGVLCTASYEARKHGVRSGMPGFIAKKLCPELTFVPLHFPRYMDMSQAVMSVFRRYDPNLFAAGCDEAYLKTFSPLRDKTKILDKLTEIAIELEKDMTENGWAGRTVTLKFKLDTYQVLTRAKSFDRWITTKEELFATGQELILPEFPLALRLIGLRVTKLKDLRAPPEPINGIKRFFGSLQDPQPRKKVKTDNREDNIGLTEPPELIDIASDEAMPGFLEMEEDDHVPHEDEPEDSYIPDTVIADNIARTLPSTSTFCANIRIQFKSKSSHYD
ncbi:hypothetical protein C0991_011416 [Blastosporella zonata]|nr:hypothetical protein C0991_011416 [Blastosporella zonata]